MISENILASLNAEADRAGRAESWTPKYSKSG